VEGDIVIQDSRMMYRRPVTGDFRARATFPPLEEFDRLLHTLQRRGRGRLEISAAIEQDGVVAVDFIGTFAVAA
jgi:thioesterase domain-containing protein